MEEISNLDCAANADKPCVPETSDPIAMLYEAMDKIEEQGEIIATLKVTVSSQDEKIAVLNNRVAKQNECLDDFNDHLVRLQDQANAEFKRMAVIINSRLGPGNVGKTTAKRCDEVVKLLRSNNGLMSFKILRTKMGLRPNQFSRVIAALDKRRFDIITKPGSREKVLKLKCG